MRLRILVLSALLVTAGIMIGLAGPPVLVPAEGSPISVRAANNVAIGDVNNDGRSDLIVTSGQSRRVTIPLVSAMVASFLAPTTRSMFLRVLTKSLSVTSMATRTWTLHSPITTATASSSCLGMGAVTFSPHRAPQL